MFPYDEPLSCGLRVLLDRTNRSEAASGHEGPSLMSSCVSSLTNSILIQVDQEMLVFVLFLRQDALDLAERACCDRALGQGKSWCSFRNQLFQCNT